ncbi:Eukaryotic translation initiation factor 5 [Nymphon striatum]|nr:Eukaryotic translation initiation factor 5 [Nymphon striatum]
MGSVNVNRNVTDQFYRYKMPRLIAKVEGKGNGIKTVIANMVDIGKSLSRPPTYPTKFFGCELGAQTQFDAKNDRFIVNGSHDSSKLQDLLDIFIRKFVLCPECDNPETELIILQKKQMISQKCIACGYVQNVDMRHKLTTFILKNPPGQEPGSTPSGKKGKKSKKEEKSAKQNGAEHNESSEISKPDKNNDSDEKEVCYIFYVDNSDVEYEPMESDNETIDSYESDDVLSEHEDDSVMLSDSWKRIADIFSDCRPNSLPELVRNFSGINPALNCNANNSILENFKKFITNDVINYLVKNDSKKNRNARSAGAAQVVLKGLKNISLKLDTLNDTVDEDDWAVDTDADAVARRMEDLTDGAKGLMLNDDMAKTQQERIDIFYVFVKRRKSEGKLNTLGKELYGEAERLDIKDKATLVLSELIFDENMIQQIKLYRSILLRFTQANGKAQKYLLGGFEQLVQMHKDALMPKVAHILKAFYDYDILEEETLIQWSKKVSKKYVKKDIAQEIHDKVSPFIKWLQEAEEEESSEEEHDDEEVEVSLFL